MGNWIVEGRQSRIYDSLLAVLSSFPDATPSHKRRCIVVLVTSSDAGSRHTAGDVTLAAKSKNTAVFVALISRQASRLHLTSGGVKVSGPDVNENEEMKALEPLSSATGGDARVYLETQYVIAKAIHDMVNK